MSLATSNRDGGKTSESGHLRALYKAFGSGVISGLAVSQRGAGANMSVDVAIGDSIIGRSDGTYGHPSFNDAVYNVAITAADPTNPRRDIVIMYIDYTQTPSTAVSNNTNGVVKIAVVAGTPAGSPSDPSDAAINSAAGSGNPWIKLARVRVGAGVTSIGTSVIDDLRRMLIPSLNGGWIYDTVNPWVYASASTFTVAGVDVTSQFPVGTKIALYQSGSIKYFYVTGSSFSTNTTITVDGGGTYTLANVPIDKPAYSYEDRPIGFPYTSISNPKEWWQEIGRTTLTVAGDTITVSGLPPRKHLKIIVLELATGGTLDTSMRFNSDSSTNYNYNYSIFDGNTNTNSTGQTGLPLETGTVASGDHNKATVEVLNIAAREKTAEVRALKHVAASPGGSPFFVFARWANTSVEINRVDVINTGTGDFAIGSEVIVLGHD
jgi:hypothetical protein